MLIIKRKISGCGELPELWKLNNADYESYKYFTSTSIVFVASPYLCSVKQKSITRTNKKNMKKIRYYADVTRTGLPFIQIPMDESKGIIMMIDTGANSNVMFSYAYAQLKDVLKEEDEKSSLYGLDGKPNLVNFSSGEFSICGKTYNIRFLIQRDDEAGLRLSEDMGFPVCGMIGSIFLAEHGWMLDYVHQEILIPDVEVSVENIREKSTLLYTIDYE